jgi:hypothetical protein
LLVIAAAVTVYLVRLKTISGFGAPASVEDVTDLAS